MATEASIERDLAAVTRKHRERTEDLAEATAQRDRVIRDALAAKLPRPRIAELTGLSTQRIDQIHKGTRT